MPAVPLLTIPIPPALSLVQARRAAVLLPVLVLHLLMLWLLTQARPERYDAKSALARQPMVLRWIEAVVIVPPASPSTSVKSVPETSPTQPPRVVTRAITQAAPTANPWTPLPQAEAITAPASTPELAPTSTESARPTTAPLDLNLRRSASSPPSVRSLASQATQDSRANSERTSFGEKLAEALGSDNRRTEENLGDGRIRFRSAADCVVVHESRAGQLDPMGQTSRPAPRGAKACN
jgi:hypothetical protein